MSEPRIEVSGLTVHYGDVPAVNGVAFAIRPGELVTLLGPSGCGKTSTLRAIAGLEDPSGGSIRLNGQTMYSAAERRNVPAEKRGLSMVFQSYAIWPHMTVFENVAYGLKIRRLPRAEIEANVARVLDLVQMSGLADRPAANLSGGQQQRIAVARAIAFSPGVLLFDEPLSNLDAKLRAEMRVELRELQRRLDITALYVTHDQEEALAISDRVIVMNAGRIEQIGTPEAMYNRPESRFVADFVGAANLIPGQVIETCAEGIARFRTEVGGVVLRVAAIEPMTAGSALLALRSAYVTLHKHAGGHNLPNAMAGSIHRRMFHGDFIQYVVRLAGGAAYRSPAADRDAGGGCWRDAVVCAGECGLAAKVSKDGALPPRAFQLPKAAAGTFARYAQTRKGAVVPLIAHT